MHVARYGLKRLLDNWKNKNLLFENSCPSGHETYLETQ